MHLDLVIISQSHFPLIRKRDVHRQFHVVYMEYNEARRHVFSSGQYLILILPIYVYISHKLKFVYHLFVKPSTIKVLPLELNF